MLGIDSNITKEELEKFDGDIIDKGRTVESFVSHNGWQLLMIIFVSEELRIKNKSDYKTMEDFKADRKALKIVQGMIDELKSYIDDSKEAVIRINALKKAESQTPNLLSVDGEGENEE